MRCEWEYRNPGPSIQDGRAREGLGSVICARERERERKKTSEGGREGGEGREGAEGGRERERERDRAKADCQNDGDSFRE